eukprot:403334289
MESPNKSSTLKLQGATLNFTGLDTHAFGNSSNADTSTSNSNHSIGSHSPAHSDQDGNNSSRSGGSSGLKLTLIKSSLDNDDEQMEMDEDDEELLEYQRSRSTPKIEITEFAEDEDQLMQKEQNKKQKKEMFTQFYESHLKSKLEIPREYTIEDLEEHSNENNCWTCIDGKIYNIAPFVHMHPGGKKILRGAGKDATEMYHKFHANTKIDESVVGLLFEGYLKK